MGSQPQSTTAPLWASPVAFSAHFAGSQAVLLLLVFAAFTEAGPLAAGIVIVLRSAPALLAQLFSGTLYDRWSPRLLLSIVGALEITALVTAATPWVSSTAVLAILTSVLGFSTAVYDTTVTAYLRDSGVRPLASAVWSGLAVDSGKLLAAGLAWWATQSLIPAVAVCIALDLPAVLFLARRAPRRGLGAHNTTRAIGSWARPLLPALPALLLLNLTTGSMLFWQGYLAQGSATLFALLNVSLAIGAVLGNLLLAKAGMTRGSITAGILTCSGGLLTMGVAGTTRPWALGVGALIWGAGAAWWFQGLRGWLISSAPEGIRGRTSSLMLLSGRAALAASGLALGATAQLVGPTWATGLAALCGVLSAALLPRQSPWRARKTSAAPQ